MKSARRRVEALFAGVASNDDEDHYQTAMGVLSGRYEWLEQGVVPAPTHGTGMDLNDIRHAAAGN